MARRLFRLRFIRRLPTGTVHHPCVITFRADVQQTLTEALIAPKAHRRLVASGISVSQSAGPLPRIRFQRRPSETKASLGYSCSSKISSPETMLIALIAISLLIASVGVIYFLLKSMGQDGVEIAAPGSCKSGRCGVRNIAGVEGGCRQEEIRSGETGEMIEVAALGREDAVTQQAGDRQG